MSEINIIHNVSTVSAEDSLVLPDNMTLEAFKIDNWRFVELPLKGRQDGTVYHLMAECKLMGFEDWKYDWRAAELDITKYGGGTEQGWKRYVIDSFENVLQTKREQFLHRLGIPLKSADRKE